MYLTFDWMLDDVMVWTLCVSLVMLDFGMMFDAVVYCMMTWRSRVMMLCTHSSSSLPTSHNALTSFHQSSTRFRLPSCLKTSH